MSCYFNPAAYQRRIANYRAFRKHLTAPLVTVELSFDGRFELRDADADVLVQIHGGSILWQKERLLNIALTRVPSACGKVAWIDCDVIFASDDWAARAVDALEEFDLIHLFDEVQYLPRDAEPDRRFPLDPGATARSAVHKWVGGEAAPEDLCLANSPLERRSTTGLAWAVARPVLETHGFYDACVLGSGARVMTCAALGEFAYGQRASLMNARQADHYLRWAQPFYGTVRDRVGYIEGRLLHLWDGERIERRYGARHQDLQRFAFDPFTDIAPDPNGCWRWNTEKPEMHAFVKQYFRARNEDGLPTEARLASVRR